MEIDLEVLGSRIRTAREAARMSQRELAKRIGVSPSFVSRIEAGERGVSLDTLKAIAKALELSVDDFIQDEGTAYSVRFPEGRQRILADHKAPRGLRDLASDQPLIDVHMITDEEWRTLYSVDMGPWEADKWGYLQLLTTLRAIRRLKRA
ncbi:MAG: XRE family transcriptional regulator [Gammaproteobacteria bacterium]|nr:MAG: XRE family transcriptional regulator [Gammaproteobacteria bacterium]